MLRLRADADGQLKLLIPRLYAVPIPGPIGSKGSPRDIPPSQGRARQGSAATSPQAQALELQKSKRRMSNRPGRGAPGSVCAALRTDRADRGERWRLRRSAVWSTRVVGIMCIAVCCPCTTATSSPIRDGGCGGVRGRALEEARCRAALGPEPPGRQCSWCRTRPCCRGRLRRVWPFSECCRSRTGPRCVEANPRRSTPPWRGACRGRGHRARWGPELLLPVHAASAVHDAARRGRVTDPAVGRPGRPQPRPHLRGRRGRRVVVGHPGGGHRLEPDCRLAPHEPATSSRPLVASAAWPAGRGRPADRDDAACSALPSQLNHYAVRTARDSSTAPAGRWPPEVERSGPERTPRVVHSPQPALAGPPLNSLQAFAPSPTGCGAVPGLGAGRTSSTGPPPRNVKACPTTSPVRESSADLRLGAARPAIPVEPLLRLGGPTGLPGRGPETVDRLAGRGRHSERPSSGPGGRG